MAVRQVAVDSRPARAVIGGLENVRLAAVHQMGVDGDVRGTGVEVRRLDLRHDAPGRQRGDVLRHVAPFGAAVARYPELAVVGSRPHDAFLNFGERDREHDLARELTEVVADDAAGRYDARAVLCGEI